MSKIKVLISSPTQGFSYEKNKERYKAYQKAIEKRLNQEVEIIGGLFTDRVRSIYSPIWQLGERIKTMSRSDIICFVGNWEHARECVIEHEAAKMYNMTILDLNETGLDITSVSVPQSYGKKTDEKTVTAEAIKAILALDGDKKNLAIIANETAIIAKMLYFAEQHSIEEAMRYYAGTHSDIEYKDFLEERL